MHQHQDSINLTREEKAKTNLGDLMRNFLHPLCTPQHNGGGSQNHFFSNNETQTLTATTRVGSSNSS